MQDLPYPFWCQLLGVVLEQESRRCLFGTCKLLCSLTLARAHDVQCKLDISTVTPTQAARSLQLLTHCKEGAEVKLVLKDSRAVWYNLEHDLATEMSTWLTTLCTQHGSVLQPVTHLKIKGHVAGGLIPCGIEECCPRMTHFTRWGWFPNQPQTDAVSMGPCPQLQHLTIHHLSPCDPRLGAKSNIPAEQLQQQFSLLPNLQSLTCQLEGDYEARDLGYDPRYDAAGAYLTKILQQLHKQLKSLTLPNGEFLVPVVCVHAWPQLQRLIMPEADLREDYLRLLLRQAPQIKELEVCEFSKVSEFSVDVIEFSVHDSLAHLQWKWEHLTIRNISCDLFTKLPLATLHSLRVQTLSLSKGDWSQMQAAVVALSQIKHVSTVGQGLEVDHESGFEMEDSQVPQLVTLLQALRQDHIVFPLYPVLDPCWVRVLRLLPCRTLTRSTFRIPDDCWGTILQQLPQLQVLHLQASPRESPSSSTSLPKLAEFCKCASRPVTMKIDSYLAGVMCEGWQEQLVHSMQLAGHQHVTIQVTDYLFQ